MRASTPSRSPWRTGSAAAGPTVTAGAGQPALRAQHLSKSYHSPVLRDLDLDVEQGQFVAIMGPSGSGKSTLLHCLSGMDQPDAGSVLLSGQEITSLSEKKLAALQILDLLGEIHASGTTLVMVTHDTQVAARADRVLVLVDGQITEDLLLGKYEEAEGPSRLATVTEALQRHSV